MVQYTPIVWSRVLTDEVFPLRIGAYILLQVLVYVY